MAEDVVRRLKVSRAFYLLSYVKTVAREVGMAKALELLEDCVTEMVLE